MTQQNDETKATTKTQTTEVTHEQQTANTTHANDPIALAQRYSSGKTLPNQNSDGSFTGSFAPTVEQSQEAGAAKPRPIDITASTPEARKTAHDVIEAMKNVVDPELGIDVVDLGLLYGVTIDEQGRAILTMTLTTPACPLTDLLEDGAAVALAPVVDYFKVDWVWDPVWDLSMITEEGRQMLNAIGYNFAL